MLPDTVILDTANMLRNLNKMAELANYEHPECFASYMVEELLERMRLESDAARGVRMFALSVCQGAQEYGYHSISPHFALPILNLGNHIYLQLRLYSLYRKDGVLLYHYQPVANNEFDGILLKRIYELPYYSQPA